MCFGGDSKRKEKKPSGLWFSRAMGGGCGRGIFKNRVQVFGTGRKCESLNKQTKERLQKGRSARKTDTTGEGEQRAKPLDSELPKIDELRCQKEGETTSTTNQKVKRKLLVGSQEMLAKIGQRVFDQGNVGKGSALNTRKKKHALKGKSKVTR